MADRIRLDKWLWQGRFFKTRTLAASRVLEGAVRVNGRHVTKPGATVTPGDVLTFAQGEEIRVVRVEQIGLRRGPAREARELYSDLRSIQLELENARSENGAVTGSDIRASTDPEAVNLSGSRSLE